MKGTDLTIKAEQSYDTETGDVTSQMTTLAASDADVFVLGATLLACPTALNQLGASSWKPLVYMSGTCTSKTLMNAAGANGNGVLSVTPLMDPNDPQWASNDGDVAVQGAGGEVHARRRRRGTASWRTAGRPRRCSTMRSSKVEGAEPARGHAGGAHDHRGEGRRVCSSPPRQWTVSADDWFLGEEFNLVQYSTADGFFKTIGDLQKLDGKTASITPPNLING